MNAPAEKKRRARRIASDEAHAWARHLRLGNDRAKFVLLMLAGYVNSEGTCFVSIEQLADDTEMSPDTIRRRLTWLDTVGAIVRLPQWIDEHGRRNGEGRGKRTTDEIRLRYDADPEEIEARAMGHSTGASEVPSEPVSPSSLRGLTGPDRGASAPPVALRQPSQQPSQQPSHCGQGSIDEPEPEPDSEQEESPPTPPRGGEPVPVEVGRQAEDPPWLGKWIEFEKEFTADGIPIFKVSIAKDVFSALTEAERELVTRAAKGLIASRKREKKPSAKPGAQSFLRERDAWEGYAKVAPITPPPRIFIQDGSPEYAALQVLGRILRVPSMWEGRHDTAHNARGVWREGGVPADLTGLSAFIDLPIEQWLLAEEGSPRLAAWAHRIHEWTGRWPPMDRIRTGAMRSVEIGNEAAQLPVMVNGVRVPCAWPPRKDGSISPDKGEESDRSESAA